MTTAQPNLIDEVVDLVKSNVGEIFHTVLQLPVSFEEHASTPTSTDAAVVGSIGLVGDVNCLIHLIVSEPTARQLAQRMLELDVAALHDEMVNDVIGELSNIIVGSVKSLLCDRALPCVLTMPSVVRGNGISTGKIETATRRTLHLTSDAGRVELEVHLKPAK